MEKNILSQFASQFAEASLTSLVESFNAQVGTHEKTEEALERIRRWKGM